MIEAYNWLFPIIQSSKNQFHIDSSEVLIELFWAKFKDEEYTNSLRQLKHDRWIEIHNVIH